ncbi:MAG: hypothetical protein MJ211_08550 [Bacteroidales bacterium]|nr:hypothetical protein [Bacteroidales bacterium]
MKKILIIICSLFFLNSCNKQEEIIEVTDNQQNKQICELSETGYLKFSNFDLLKEYMDNCQTIENESSDILLKKSYNLGGFQSIANLRKKYFELDEYQTLNSKSFTEDDIEDMTEEEFNLMQTEELLFDNNLTYIFDTTLRISVEGNLYKITKYGTFSVEENQSEKIAEAISDFDTTLISQIQLGESTMLANGVVFINSFGNKTISEDEIEDNNESLNNEITSKDFAENAFHVDYNCNSYKWKNHSAFQKLMDKIKGKSVKRENNFCSDKRVQVTVFDVNYGFYASAGIKVHVQKRKKFLGIKYWKETSANKIAIGFNGIEGEFKYTNPQSYSKITPTMSNYYGSFKSAINNQYYDFFYGNVKNLDFLHDWTSGIIHFIIPSVCINNRNWTQTISNNLYNMEVKFLSSLPKKIVNKYIFDEIGQQVKPKDPTVAYLLWGNTSTTYCKERPYVTGVQEYNKDSKSVIFDRSFGLSISNKSIKGFVPVNFNIKKIDAFGAAYYDGRWLGVRFYYD